jgi:hypothetical protein
MSAEKLTSIHCFAREQVGLVIIHLVMHSVTNETRRLVISTLEAQNRKDPQLTNTIVREALGAQLRRVAMEKEREKSVQGGDEDQRVDRKLGSLAAVLLACADFGDGDSVPSDEKHSLLAKLLILSHVPEISGGVEKSQLWIDLCQRAKVDPRVLISAEKELTLSVLNVVDKEHKFSQHACYRATTTLAFVAGDLVLSEILQQVKTDLDEKALGAITETDIAIWKTPEGTMYTDGL